MTLRFLAYCFLIISFTFVLTGCWDQEEIEKRATIVGLSIDKATEEEMRKDDVTHPDFQFNEHDHRYKLTAQLSVPGQVALGPAEGTNATEENVWIVEGYGTTIGDAVQSMQQKIAHDIFFGHLQVIIVSEEIAKEGLKPLNDFFHRRSEIRRTVWLAVAEGEAANTMSVAPKLEQIPAIYLSSMLDSAVDMGKFPETHIGDFWVACTSLGQSAILPYLEVYGDNIRISGLAFFDHEVMVDIVPPYKIVLYNAIKAEYPAGASLMIPIENGSVIIKSRTREAKKEIELIDGKPKITMKIRVDTEVREKSNEKIDLGNSATVQEIEENAEKTATRHAEELIKQTQVHGTDIFGFGEHIRGKLPRYWDEHVKTKERWNEIYKDLEVEVVFDITVNRIGIRAN